MGGLPNAPIPDPHVPQTEGSHIGDHRLSTSYGGPTERPDRHCGDDIVLQRINSRSLVLSTALWMLYPDVDGRSGEVNQALENKMLDKRIHSGYIIQRA